MEWIKAITEIDKARFWSNVNKTDYCWNWNAVKNKNGYGMIRMKSKNILALYNQL